jgi:hypothetical protein
MVLHYSPTTKQETQPMENSQVSAPHPQAKITTSTDRWWFRPLKSSLTNMRCHEISLVMYLITQFSFITIMCHSFSPIFCRRKAWELYMPSTALLATFGSFQYWRRSQGQTISIDWVLKPWRGNERCWQRMVYIACSKHGLSYGISALHPEMDTVEKKHVDLSN